jgi:hypothetical protein
MASAAETTEVPAAAAAAEETLGWERSRGRRPLGLLSGSHGWNGLDGLGIFGPC